MDSMVFELAALGIDVVLFGIFYKLYRNRSQNSKAVEEAPNFEIDGSLYEKIQKSGSPIPYAVISGVVKAISTPLYSQYLPNVKGVIREKVTKEHKVRWSPLLRLWNTVQHEVQRSSNNVPFALIGASGWRKTNVEILNPWAAEELILPTVYDQFTSHQNSIGEAVAGWFRGERTAGFQEIENILAEGSLLTGVGELILDNDKIKLKPPSRGLSYFLTSLSRDSLVKKLGDEAKFFKILTVLMGCMGIFMVTWIAKSFYDVRKRKLEQLKQSQVYEEARRLRRIADNTRGLERRENDTTPRCVVCMTNPVEVVILECGHTCLCMDCSEHISDLCPVCRSRIERTIPAYLP